MSSGKVVPLDARDAQTDAAAPGVKMLASHVGFRYGDQVALNDVSMPLHARQVTALVGPSGCGKSTLLRVFNRMHDLYRDQHVTGEVLLDGVNILSPHVDVAEVRRRVGMVFQQLTSFPMSIHDNLAFGILSYEDPAHDELEERIETALRRAALWDEVKDKLADSAFDLSRGQQQRLCIARAIAMRPEVLLLDEPCSALDPLSTAKIEETIDELKADCTIGIVTHNLQQAERIADYAGFMYLGRLIEFGSAADIFSSPKDLHTQQFVQGLFG